MSLVITSLADIVTAIQGIKGELEGLIKLEQNRQQIEDVRIRLIGKNGELSKLFDVAYKLAGDDKKEAFKIINLLKQDVEGGLHDIIKKIENKELEAKIKQEKLDLTIPARHNKEGRLHLLSFMQLKISRVLSNMGFSFVDGPELEDDFHNFTALNIAENHPARQMHDTFYLKTEEEAAKLHKDDKYLLRTHTSNVQIRHMKSAKPPFYNFTMGRTYRSDSDRTHTPMFHQLEVLCLDRDIGIGNLKYFINTFLQEIFDEKNIVIRLRASFFPFTEPSYEVDVGYSYDKNGNIKIGGDSNFIEILGCGMVHPVVLGNVGVDSVNYGGFALGLGIERLAMLKFGVSDVRNFFIGDVRFLEAFSLSLQESLMIG